MSYTTEEVFNAVKRAADQTPGPSRALAFDIVDWADDHLSEAERQMIIRRMQDG